MPKTECCQQGGRIKTRNEEIFIDIYTKSKHFPSFKNAQSENDLKNFCMLPVTVTNTRDAIKFLFTILNFKIIVKDKQRQSDDQ